MSHPPDQSLEIGGNFEAIHEALHGLRGTLRKEDHPAASSDTWEIVLGEAMNNIAEHAYADRQDGTIRLELWWHPDSLRLSLHDTGAAMQNGPPSRTGMPDACTLPEGGFGWPMIHALCTRIAYHAGTSGNRLDLTVPLG